MRRFSAVMRQQRFTTALPSKLSLLGYTPIAPGTTLNGSSIRITMNSVVTDQFYLSPMMIQAFSFYVPYRLVWDNWVDFIGSTNPTENTPRWSAAPDAWTLGYNGGSTLPYRAFKLVYNEYFGQEIDGRTDTWYADIADDVDYTQKLTRVWDQFQSSASSEDVSDTTLNIPVSGATATMSLRELAVSLRNYHRSKNQSLTGDKYVDTMRAMGVDLDWRLQNAPEFLGQTSVIIQPSHVENSGEQAELGAQYSRYKARFNHTLKKRRSFAEHGVIVDVFAARWAVGSNSDLAYTQISNREFFSPDTLTEYDTRFGVHPRMHMYRAGRNTTRRDIDFAKFESTNSYVDVSPTFTAAPAGPLRLAQDATHRLLTPVPPNVT